MPNRQVHCLAGVAGGALAAGYLAHDQQRFHAALETVGGMIGGYAGARLPDVIDVPNSPNHRGFAHGQMTAVSGGYAIVSSLETCQVWLRTMADEAHTKPETEEQPFLKLFYQIVEMVFRVLSGVLPGFAIGYGSHLLLDSMSPRGLPLIA